MTLMVARWGLETALLLAVALGLTFVGWRACERIGGPQPARAWLRVGYLLLAGSLVLPVLVRLGAPARTFFPPPMEVWAGRSGGPLQAGVTFTAHAAAQRPAAPAIGGRTIAVVAALLIISALLGLGHLALAAARLRRWCRRLVPFRRVGRVVVCASPEAHVPFSAFVAGRAYVVVPMALVLEPARLRLAVGHEAQHLRAGDPGWAFVAAVVRALLPWHPASHAWLRLVANLQEIACDQRMTARPGLSPRAYAECLVWAAELASRPRLVATVPMLDGRAAFLASRIRRIVYMAGPQRPPRGYGLPVGALALALLVAVAATSHDAIADRRISLEAARAIAARVERRDGFSIEVDDAVLAELNGVLANPQAAASFAEGLARMEPVRHDVEATLAAHGLPRPLLAIPQAESRYQALPEAHTSFRSAGMWQLIPQTARRFGLRVDPSVDERLDPAREREAAAQYLEALHDQFGDWSLVIAAYNNGERRVAKAIAQTGTRDAAALVRAGAISRYVSTVLAAALLMEAPELLPHEPPR